MTSRLPWKWIGLGGLLVAEVGILCLVAFWGSASAVSGLIVRSGSASIDVAEQSGPWGTVDIQRVVTPVPSWVVVQAAGAAGTVLGRTHVPAGTNISIKVSLDAHHGAINTLVVSLVGDRGQAGVFEFSAGSAGGGGSGMGMGGAGSSGSKAATAAGASPDQPLVSAGKRVAVVLVETYRYGAPGIVRRVVRR